MKLLNFCSLAMVLGLSWLPPAAADEASDALVERGGYGSFCSKVKSVVTKLHEQKAATSFCSSYLSISTTTKCTTKTPKFTTTAKVTSCSGTITTTGAPVTVTTVVTGDSTITVSTGTSTVLSTSTITETTATQAPLTICGSSPQKRGGYRPQKPACLSGYGGGILSSACRCLSIPSKTVTKTYTAPPSYSTVTSTSCNLPTLTNTPTVTSTVTETNTITVPETTVTSGLDPTTTSTSTVTLTTTGPFSIKAAAAATPPSGRGSRCVNRSNGENPCEFVDNGSDSWILNPDGTIHNERLAGPVNAGIPGTGSSTPFQIYAGVINGRVGHALYCTIEPASSGSCSMACRANDGGQNYTVSSVCNSNIGGGWMLGPDVANGCTGIELLVGPVAN